MEHYIESASAFCKEHGLSSLREVCEITGIKHSTIYRWFRRKPKLFKCVVIGASVMKIGR